jgi:hypothetical protein
VDDVVSIGDVASVSLGVTSARLVEKETLPEVPLINIKDIEHGEVLPPGQLDKVRAAVPVQQALCAGDLLVSVRGTLLKMAVVSTLHEGALATGNFAIVRPKAGKVLPEVLQAVLQSDSVRAYLLGLATGAVIKGLQVGALRAVRFRLPPLPMQRELAQLVRMSEIQRRVAIHLAEERRDLARAVVAGHIEVH